MSRCGTCGQPRDAWQTIQKTVAVMSERADAKPKRRPPTGALKFMQRLAMEGGRIVSTASLTPEQVIEARKSQRLFVTGEGLGFVIFPDGVAPTFPRNVPMDPQAMRERAAGVTPPAATFTGDELVRFYEEWEFNEEDPGEAEFIELVREVERRVLQRTRGVGGNDGR